MPNLLNGPSYCVHTKPKKLIILLHGYGDNAENFINVANLLDIEEWQAYYLSLNAPEKIPNYPLGNQWFDLYFNGEYILEKLPSKFPRIEKSIKENVKKLEDTILSYLKNLKIYSTDCMVIGFSQGGMITFELGYYSSLKLGALAILSGKIIAKNKNKNLLLKQTPIFISHGNKDEILHINNYYESIDYLKNNNYLIEAHEIENDTHTISINAINLLQIFIKKNL